MKKYIAESKLNGGKLRVLAEGNKAVSINREDLMNEDNQLVYLFFKKLKDLNRYKKYNVW